MADMRLGLFLNFEHGPDSSAAAVFKSQCDLAVKAEAFGLDEIWVSEHHFSPFSQSASVLPLLAHLAGRTSRIRVGPASVLLPLHDPVHVAEDLATIDLLSSGRLNLGLARGGPFPLQYKHFHVVPEEARARAAEATEFLLKLLTEENVTFNGHWYKSDALTVRPRPLQASLPVWIASATPETLAEAGRRGWHLMAGHAWSGTMVQGLLDLYQTAAGGHGDPQLMILRTACIADTDEEALAIARPAILRFLERMRQRSGAEAPPSSSDVDRVLTTAIVGSPQTCRQRLAELRAAVPIASLVLKPACIDPVQLVELVHRFRTEVVAPLEAQPRIAAVG
jgi:alkanesulfonate monooxygenase SsuD/methylene tetrahydromethanopterin reductase-like flavin-dependent oxidoreductase (luciferase family)